MACVQRTSLMRDAGLRREMVRVSTAGHHQQQLLHQQNPFPAFPAEEEAYAAAERSGLMWESFFVDDLLDLGGGKEQSCDDEEDLLGSEDAEEEDEGKGAREGSGSHNNSNSSPPSALSFQPPPPSSDLIFPAGDVAELEWVSRFVDDSYSEFPSSSMAPPFHHHHNATAPALPAATAKSEAPKARFTSSGNPLKRSWGRCCFFTDSLVVPSKARSKRCRRGGRVWCLHRPPFLAESSTSSCSSASSCSASSSSSSISPILLYDSFAGGCPTTLQQQPPRLQEKKRGRKPKARVWAPAAAGGGEQQQQLQQPRRRCSHCGVDRTPQWRAGPMGAKTLCNACGVRYKSGRLLPEYRPAGSPTFLSHLHSNSHRKVLEMRRSKELAAAPASCSASPSQPAAATAQLHGVV